MRLATDALELLRQHLAVAVVGMEDADMHRTQIPQ
jgi:hypothetical protein